MRTDAAATLRWARTAFPDLRLDEASVRFGAFHDVVLAGPVVLRVTYGRDHAARAAREHHVLGRVGSLDLGLAVPRLRGDPVTLGDRTGYPVGRVDGTECTEPDWSAAGEQYAAVLAGFARVPVAGLDLPPVRNWCVAATSRVW